MKCVETTKQLEIRQVKWQGPQGRYDYKESASFPYQCYTPSGIPWQGDQGFFSMLKTALSGRSTGFEKQVPATSTTGSVPPSSTATWYSNYYRQILCVSRNLNSLLCTQANPVRNQQPAQEPFQHDTALTTLCMDKLHVDA
eukprot:2026424-Amphidinium_carterae.1